MNTKKRLLQLEVAAHINAQPPPVGVLFVDIPDHPHCTANGWERIHAAVLRFKDVDLSAERASVSESI